MEMVFENVSLQKYYHYGEATLADSDYRHRHIVVLYLKYGKEPPYILLAVVRSIRIWLDQIHACPGGAHRN